MTNFLSQIKEEGYILLIGVGSGNVFPKEANDQLDRIVATTALRTLEEIEWAFDKGTETTPDIIKRLKAELTTNE